MADREHPYNQRYWADRANWKWGLFYDCPADPRLVVPKKPKWAGYTINFGHAGGWWLLLWILLYFGLPVPLWLLLVAYEVELWIVLVCIYGTIAVQVVLMLLWCHRAANPLVEDRLVAEEDGSETG